MYRVAVCDDELLYLDGHCAMAASVLAEAGIAHEIEAFGRAEVLMARLQGDPYGFDMLILDILLGADNGVALARSLRNGGYTGGILFVTNAPEYSLAGYSVYPTHFLLKPLRLEVLREALLRDFSARHALPSMNVPIKGGVAQILLGNILYVESQLSSTTFHLKGRELRSPLRLKDVRGLLPEDSFVQCHKSYIVAIGQVRDITRAGITLRSGQALPVGRVYYDETLSRFAEHLQD